MIVLATSHDKGIFKKEKFCNFFSSISKYISAVNFLSMMYHILRNFLCCKSARNWNLIKIHIFLLFTCSFVNNYPSGRRFTY